jgi:hypothetical protein
VNAYLIYSRFIPCQEIDIKKNEKKMFFGESQSPFFSHFAIASRNLGTTAWSLTGPMPGMPSASASDLGLLERKNGKRNGVWEVKP